MLQLKICRKNINKYVFFCEWDVKKRRTTAGDNFLTSYTQNYCYILNKLGTLTLKASARFFARRKKTWLAEAANCSLMQEVLLQAEKCLTLKLSKELT